MVFAVAIDIDGGEAAVLFELCGLSSYWYSSSGAGGTYCTPTISGLSIRRLEQCIPWEEYLLYGAVQERHLCIRLYAQRLTDMLNQIS